MEEEKPKKSIVVKEFLIYCIFDDKKHITDIMTEIRAITGVVTVSIFESEKKITENKKMVKLRMKFLQFSDIIDEDIKILKKDILSVEGVYNIVMKIRKIDLDNRSKNNV